MTKADIDQSIRELRYVLERHPNPESLAHTVHVWHAVTQKTLERAKALQQPEHGDDAA